MRLLLLALLFQIFLFTQLLATEEYPSWFLYPKNFSGIITGYKYNNSLAKKDAAINYCVFKSCVVYGTLEIFVDPSSTQWLKNSDYYYYYSPDSFEVAKRELVGVDSFFTNILNGDYIAAYFWKHKKTLPQEWLKVRELKIPEWISKTFWEDGDYAYGVGIFSSQRNENDAWKTAEEQAIFTILTNKAIGYYSIKVYTQEKNQKESSYQEISFIRLKYYLKNIEIVERFPDLEQQTFYVLVRIAKQNMISPMLKN